MSLTPFDLCSTSNQALLDALSNLSARGAGLEADLLVYLSEVDVRGVVLNLGFNSLFSYCVEVLHFSESVAFHRITAARATRGFPQILERIRSGELHLSGLRLLAPHLTTENCGELLDLARHQSKRAIEERLANRAPKPDAPGQLRRLPDRAAQSKPLTLDSPAAPLAFALAPAAAPIPTPTPVTVHARPSSEPLGGSRYKVQFTAGPATHAKLREAQALLRHQVPDGDLGQIFERALDALLRDVRRVKFAETQNPRAQPKDGSGPAPRHIPAAIRRAVAKRDRERCAFVSTDGRSCEARDALEFHHVVPFARSHRHRVDDITLRCRAHNTLAAKQDFGAEHMARFRRDFESAVTRSGASCGEREPASAWD